MFIPSRQRWGKQKREATILGKLVIIPSLPSRCYTKHLLPPSPHDHNHTTTTNNNNTKNNIKNPVLPPPRKERETAKIPHPRSLYTDTHTHPYFPLRSSFLFFYFSPFPFYVTAAVGGSSIFLL
jgi:hypothetical protein